ncbi:sigma-70 family RNA polymerase sigma factor [Dyella sp. RRB7]|uniref:RNA polymerase sigma factor n=1 Tax=Dyella sp. RRB7 TaxID=2919502 RepID=UPI001FA99AA3|nr:sigma-70 family RNA polymerase sigma factor [Dyella sp. RRB7]
MTDRQYQQRFEALLREHQGIVLKVAGAYARDREERNDLAQEICTQLWRAFSSFDERLGRFSTWMYRIALNVAISQRRRVRSAQVYFEPLEAHHLDSIGGHAIDEPDERLAALYRFIGQLDPLNRALILLYLEDRSYAEIAYVLGISETNVATKISRVKQKLREQAAQMALSEET